MVAAQSGSQSQPAPQPFRHSARSATHGAVGLMTATERHDVDPWSISSDVFDGCLALTTIEGAASQGGVLVVWSGQSGSMRAAIPGSMRWPALASTEQQHPLVRASGPPGASWWATEWSKRAGSCDVSAVSWSIVSVRGEGSGRPIKGGADRPDRANPVPTGSAQPAADRAQSCGVQAVSHHLL